MVREFSLKPARGPITQLKTINPDTVGYKRPDFGFNDFLTFEEKQHYWKRVSDCIKNKPEQERLQNYISFIQQKKCEALNIHAESGGEGNNSDLPSVRDLLRQKQQGVSASKN